MAKNSLNDWSTTPASNTDIAGTNIDVGCPPQDVGVYMRTVMAQIAYGVQGSGGTIPATWHVGGQAISGKLGVGTSTIPTGRFLDIVVNGTANSANQARIAGYQASWEVLNQAATVNWYFGVNDADNNALYIGGGRSPGQAITPAIKVSATTGAIVLDGLAGGSNTMLTLTGAGGSSATLQSIQTGTSSTTHEFFVNGNGTVGSITTNGSTTAFNTTSDQRLKFDDGLIGADDAWSVLKRLRPRWFRFKSDPDAEPRPGFFAQQVARVFPWAVTKGNGRPGSKNFRPWQIDDGTLMPMLVVALQDAQRRLAVLESKS